MSPGEAPVAGMGATEATFTFAALLTSTHSSILSINNISKPAEAGMGQVRTAMAKMEKIWSLRSPLELKSTTKLMVSFFLIWMRRAMWNVGRAEVAEDEATPLSLLQPIKPREGLKTANPEKKPPFCWS
jgi:hypothetical protein